MHMLITPMRCKGVALSPHERRRYPAIRADVLVAPQVANELGRSSNVARVSKGMPLEPDPLPMLLDATLAGMAPTGFVLSGIEYVDGCAYEQSGGAGWARERQSITYCFKLEKAIDRGAVKDYLQAIRRRIWRADLEDMRGINDVMKCSHSVEFRAKK